MTSTRLSPLPVAVRIFHGENARSYAGRLLRSNGVDLLTLSTWLRVEHDVHAAMGSPEWMEVLRTLGRLAPNTLNAPTWTTKGEWVTDRRLCIECCDGYICSGRLPTVGKICLKHHRWLDTGTVVNNDLAIAAEKSFQKTLVPRGETYDGLAMARAFTTALLCGVPRTADGADLEHEYFAAQVALAERLLELVARSDAVGGEPRILESELATVLGPFLVDVEYWRGVEPVRRTLVELRGLDRVAAGNADGVALDQRVPFR